MYTGSRDTYSTREARSTYSTREARKTLKNCYGRLEDPQELLREARGTPYTVLGG